MKLRLRSSPRLGTAGRDTSPHRCGSGFACVLFLLVCALGGCNGPGSRLVRRVELQPIQFEHPAAPLALDVELCIPPALRMRQWNVDSHRYIVELGSRASLNLERMAQAAFEDVVVSFEAECGLKTSRPWFTAVIVAANRDSEELGPEPIDTSVTMAFELFSDEGTSLWSLTTKGAVRGPAVLPFSKITRGANDFGRAMKQAFEEGFRELMEAETLREPRLLEAARDLAPTPSETCSVAALYFRRPSPTARPGGAKEPAWMKTRKNHAAAKPPTTASSKSPKA